MRLLSRRARSPAVRAAARWLLLVLGVLTCGVLGLAFAVDRFGQKDRARRAQAIVVLGARVLETCSAPPSLALMVVSF